MALEVSKDILISGVTIQEKSILGKGSYGVVYLGEYFGAPVAAKRLHEIFFDYDTQQEGVRGILKGFSHEWSLLKTLKHPNIVEFFGVFCPLGGKKERDFCSCYIVCELLEMSLQERISTGPELDFRQIVDISKQIASGLRYLHERPYPIMHRDLASKNVLLSSSGEAKIADLGVAKILSREKQKQNTRHPGTDSYMPVEVRFAELDYDQTIDVFSMGVVILEMTINRESRALEPFTMTGGSLQIIPERERRKKDFRDLTSKDRNIPLEKIIAHCLEEKGARPQAKKVWEDMDALCGHLYYTECKPIPLVGRVGVEEEQSTTRAASEVENHENEAFVHSNSELQSELQELSESNQKLRKEVARLNHRLDCVQSNSTSQLQEKDDKIVDLEKANRQLSSEVANISGLLKITEKQQQDTNKRLTEVLANNRQLKEKVSDLTEQNELLNSQKVAFRNLQSQRNMELEAEIQALREKLPRMTIGASSSHESTRLLPEIRNEESTNPSMMVAETLLPSYLHHPSHRSEESTSPSMMVAETSMPSSFYRPSRRREELVVSNASIGKLRTNLGPTVVQGPFSTLYDNSMYRSELPLSYTSGLYTSRNTSRPGSYHPPSTLESSTTQRPYHSWPNKPGEISVDDLENEKTFESELKEFRESIKALPVSSSKGDVELTVQTRIIKERGDKLKQFLLRSNYYQHTGPRDYVDDEEISTSLQLQKECDKLLHTVAVIMECDVNNDVMLLKAASDLVQSGTVLLANLNSY